MVVAGYTMIKYVMSGKRYLNCTHRQIEDAEPLGRWTNRVLMGKAIIQMLYFPSTNKTELGTLEWEYQEQEPPFGGTN
jgi:hypothetical protein